MLTGFKVSLIPLMLHYGIHEDCLDLAWSELLREPVPENMEQLAYQVRRVAQEVNHD